MTSSMFLATNMTKKTKIKTIKPTTKDLMLSQLDLMVLDKHISQDVAYLLRLRNISNVVDYLFKRLYETN